ncbi:zinc finger matrin-type protein 3 [Thalassophryne amazonica]|uniref:zinc finger matrin-type protein 3 n=1 Tax=Thalassophryne amazonica TaxID=390379 RepID=UPI001471F87A|nr:zinc finger matrin-type protein 3 [Thalassophryne amazonica]
MMALQLKSGDAAYYHSAEFCRTYASAPISYGDSSHYLTRLPGPETILKHPLSLFSHPQQPFHHVDSLHQLGPPPMVPTQPLCPPPLAPAQAIGPPAMVPTQSLGPPPITATHTLRPPHITSAHRLVPPPIAQVQHLGPPPMAHTLGPPPVDPAQVIVPPAINLTQPMRPLPQNPAQAPVPPPVVAPGSGRFPFPPSPLSSPPAPGPDPSQLPSRPPVHAVIPAPVSGFIPGPIAGQPAPVSEQPEQPPDEGCLLGMEEHEDSLGLEELCKPLYCKLCNVTLNSPQQAQAHYQGKNHSKKLRNFYAGSQQPPAIRITESPEMVGQAALSSGPSNSDTAKQALYKGATRVILATENDYCKLCDASFSSPAVAQAHYQGKNHAKKLRLVEAQQTNNIESSTEAAPRRNRKDCNEYRLVKNRRTPQIPASVPGPYYNPRPRQRIPRDLAMCVTPSGQFYCSMCNCGAEQETDFRQHLESKQHKAKVSELRYRNEMENMGYS